MQLNDKFDQVSIKLTLLLTMKNISLFKRTLFNAAFAVTMLTTGTIIFAQTAMPKPREEKLLNGLKVLMWSDANAKDVSVKIRIHAGAAFDPQGKEGVMKLLSDNIFPNEVARDFFREDLGGGLSIITNYDYIQINATSTPANDDFLKMIETLAAAIADPTIDKQTTAKLKEVLLAQVKQFESDPAYVANQVAGKRLFGTFPYGRPQFGSSESIAKIDFADLLDAKQRFLTADNATVTISGNFDKTLGFRAVRRYFGAWLKSDKRVPSTFRQPDPPPTALLTVASPKADVSAIRFAVRGTSRSDKDFAASKIYALILENRLRSRVPAAFSNMVFARAEEHTLPGIILIGFSASKNDIGTGNGKIDGNELIAKALLDQVTETEFQTARSAFSSEWAKRDVQTFWLDADTYKTGDANAESKIADVLTVTDVRVFAEKIQKSPLISVLVNTPAN